VKYRIADKYRKVDLDHASSILVSEDSGDIFQSDWAIKILNRICENALTKEELLQECSTFAAIQEGLLTIHQLESGGYITTHPVVFPTEQSAYWESCGYNIALLETILKNKSISLVSIGAEEVTELENACRTTGIEFCESPDLTVVIADDYAHPDLEAFNKKAIRENQPWLLVKLNGTVPLVGPLFTPQESASACWKCMEHRFLLHDQQHRLYRAVQKTNTRLVRPLTSHPMSRQIAASTAVLEIIAWLYHGTSKKLENQLIAIDTISGKQSEHRLVKRPQCPVCGNGHLMQMFPKAIQLKRASLEHVSQGGYRIVKPEETLSRYEHHVSPITGIVPYLKKYQPIDGAPIYNYGSGKNLALQSTSLFWLNLHLRSANGGKGKTEIQAKTGALCEAIERYSLMYHDKIYTVSESLQKMDKAIHPNACMLYSENQFKKRAAINAESTKFYSLIPLAFDTEKKVDWTPVYSLTEQDFKYLPSQYCFAQYPAEDENNLYSYPDSNGCAAGNTIEEAILQGFLELVERDAAAIWWYNRIRRPEVDLKSAANPYVTEMMAYYKQIGRSLYVLDLTTDLEIPVFVALSHCEKTQGKDQIIYAFGAHLDVALALERAVVELNQLLPIVVKKKGEYLTKDQVFIDWLDGAKLQEEAYLVPLENQMKNVLTDYPKLCEATLYDSIQFCMDVTKRNGLETLVLDLTQPDIGLPVVKVMVPGLRHFWRRTAPGRLYDVPVKMGWLQEKYTEPQLNPWSIFI
jgi:bacteriocin biosynthesis cyclodehydratase domain-containing protein